MMSVLLTVGATAIGYISGQTKRSLAEKMPPKRRLRAHSRKKVAEETVSPKNTSWDQHDEQPSHLSILQDRIAPHLCGFGHVASLRKLLEARPIESNGSILSIARFCLRSLLPCPAPGIRKPGEYICRVRLLFFILGQLVGTLPQLHRPDDRTFWAQRTESRC